MTTAQQTQEKPDSEFVKSLKAYPIQTFAEYVPLTVRTLAPKAFGLIGTNGEPMEGPEIDYLHSLVGPTSEDGEMVGCLKANIFYGKLGDKVNLAEELGDRWWYLGLKYRTLAAKFGRTFDFPIRPASELKDHVLDVGFAADTYFERSAADKLVILTHVAEMTRDSASDLGELSMTVAESLTPGTQITINDVWTLAAQHSGEDEGGELSDYEFNSLLALTYLLLGTEFDVRRIWTANIIKLAKRFEDKFTQEEAIERTRLAEERTGLEADLA